MFSMRLDDPKSRAYYELELHKNPRIQNAKKTMEDPVHGAFLMKEMDRWKDLIQGYDNLRMLRALRSKRNRPEEWLPVSRYTPEQKAKALKDWADLNGRMMVSNGRWVKEVRRIEGLDRLDRWVRRLELEQKGENTVRLVSLTDGNRKIYALWRPMVRRGDDCLQWYCPETGNCWNVLMGRKTDKIDTDIPGMPKPILSRTGRKTGELRWLELTKDQAIDDIQHLLNAGHTVVSFTQYLPNEMDLVKEIYDNWLNSPTWTANVNLREVQHA